MKKFLYILLFLVFLSSCTNHSVEKKVNLEKKTKKNVTKKIDKEYQKYLNVVNSFNLTWCTMFTWDVNERCKFVIMSSLDKIRKESDCNVFKKYKNECLENFYETNYLCDKLKDLHRKKNCFDSMYYTKAMDKKSDYWCLYIENNELKLECRKNIYKIKTAKKQNNKNGWSCSLSVANKKCKENDKKCMVSKLLAQVSITPSLKEQKKICEKVKSLDKEKWNICLQNYFYKKAVEYLDVDSCDKISDMELKNRCKQDAMFQKAVEMTKLDLCDKLQDNKKKDECNDKVILRIITRDRIKDKKMCEKVRTNTYKTACYDLIIKNM